MQLEITPDTKQTAPLVKGAKVKLQYRMSVSHVTVQSTPKVAKK
jgi:hypothetical protein